MPSSVVAKVNYDAETATLQVIYVSGSIYDYLDVPEEVYKEMITSFSKGIYLNQKIKKRYKFTKVR